MWIDEEKIRTQDYDPREFDEGELCSPEEQAEFERKLQEEIREEIAYGEAKQAAQAAQEFSDVDYPF